MKRGSKLKHLDCEPQHETQPKKREVVVHSYAQDSDRAADKEY